MKKILGFISIIIPIMVVLIVVAVSSIVGQSVDIPVEGITIGTESSVVLLNSNTKLDYEVLPKLAHNKEVVFKSSDESIATVDQQGNISFIGYGKVFITVTTVDGYKSKTCEYNVQSKEAFGINLTTNKNEIIANTDDNFAVLSSTIIPTSAEAKEIIYESSDENIAIVNSNGIVTAISPGLVTIKAYTKNKEISQSIDITVSKIAKSFTLIANDVDDKYVSVSPYLNLNATFDPIDTTEKYKQLTYKSLNEKIATVNKNGQVHFLKEGEVKIKAETSTGIEDYITLFYTGGLPNNVSCSFPDNYTHIYNNEDLSLNSGKIQVDFPEDCSIRNILFKSTNENVVSINNFGEYTILSGGQCSIIYTVKIATFKNNTLVIEDINKEIKFNVIRNAEQIECDDNIYITNNKYKIQANVLPIDTTNKVLTYKSLNSIATVDKDGNVIFNNPGKAEIELSCNTQNGVINKVINIISSLNNITECNINIPVLLKLGSQYYIDISLKPYNASTISNYWTIEDESIVTISNNKIFAANTGNTNITYNYELFDYNTLKLTQAKKTFNITVYEGVESVTFVPELDKEQDNIYYTGIPQINTITTINPSSAECKTYYKSSNNNIATIDDQGKIFFKQIGNVKITITVIDVAGVETTKYFYIKYVSNNPTYAELDTIQNDIWPGETIIINLINIKPANITTPFYTITDSNNLLNINGNKLTAKKAGNTIIKIEFLNGFTLYKELVIKQAVENIELNNIPSITANNKILIEPKLYPINAFNNNYSINVSNTDIADIINENGNNYIQFKKQGQVKITVTALDNRGAKTEIDVKSTLGNIDDIIIDNKVVQGNSLPINIIPSDYTNDDIKFNIISENPDIIGEHVLVLNPINMQIDTLCSGSAKFSLEFNSKIKEFNVEVQKIVGGITELIIDDITITSGESKEISYQAKTNIINKDIESLYLKHLNINFQDTTGITFSNINGTYYVSSNTYGIYNINASVNLVECKFTVTVLLNKESVAFNNLADDKILTSTTLSKDPVGNIITGTNKINIGLPNIDETIISNSDISFELKLNNSIGSIDNMGNIIFNQPGTTVVQVLQTLLLKDSTIKYVSATPLDIVTITYSNKTQTFDLTLDNDVKEIGSTINIDYEVNKELNFNCINVYPKNPTLTPKFTIVREKPNVQNGDVINIVNNKLVVVGGGSCSFNVTINDLTYTYNLNIIRYVESIDAKDIITYKSTLDLLINVLPIDATNKQVTYESDNLDIAAINEHGQITFNKAGLVNITIKAIDGSNIVKIVKVKSTNGGINDFTIPSNISINKGDKYSILNNIEVIPKEVATPNSFVINIVSQTANNDEIGDVILNEDGLLTGLIGGQCVINISLTNAFGQEKVHQIKITVHEDVESINTTEVKLELDKNNNYLTAINSYTISANILPKTADNITVTWSSSDENVATVNDGKITFINKGLVTIKVISNSNNQIYQTFNFNYVKDDAYYAEVSSFPNTTMNVGDTFTFTATNVQPSNLSNIVYRIEIIENNTNNLVDGYILTIENNKITATLGGTCKINIYVNDYKVNTTPINIEVKRAAQSIEITNDSIIVEDKIKQVRKVQIDAKLLPLDTSETILYSLISGSNVSVDNNGLVTFLDFGVAQIKLTSSEGTLSKVITIEYKEKVLQNIYIKPMVLPKGALIGGESYTIEVYAKYIESDDLIPNTNLTFRNDTQNLYTIDANGKITALNAYGTASLFVSYLINGKTFTETLEWIVAPNITHISLVLKDSDNHVGIKSERVFGMYSYKNANPGKFPINDAEITNELINTYQMNLTPDTELFGGPVIWSTSDQTIATINANGLLTMLKPGVIKITCKPKYQATSTNTASYTMKIVKGVNTYNIEQYELYTGYLATLKSNSSAYNHLPVVLHSDIIYTSNHKANFEYIKNEYRAFRGISSLFGNGHTIDAREGKESPYSSPRTFQLFEDDVLIDNVTIIGSKFKKNPNLKDMENRPVTMTVRSINLAGGPQLTTDNVVIANSTIQNGKTNIEAYSANFKVTGCVFKNSFYANININWFGSSGQGSHLEVEDCAFKDGLCGGIELKADKANGSKEKRNILTLIGNIYVDNWRNKDEVPGNTLLGIDVAAAVKKAFKELEQTNPDAFRQSNGKNYLNLFLVKAELFNVPDKDHLGQTLNYNNYGEVKTDQLSSQYMPTFNVQDSLPIGISAKLELSAPTYNLNGQDIILPGMNQVLVPGVHLNSTIYEHIRETNV